jgi:hypothetical protein
MLGACGVANAPHIDAVAPTTAARGATVTLTGSKFCQDAGVNADGTCAGAVPGTVDFSVDGPVQAEVTSWTDTTIVVTVPSRAPLGETEIYLTSSGKSSNALLIVIQ